MPQTVTAEVCGGVLANAAIGFHGKIPARGDFVQAGLPRAFVAPWDAWMQRMVAASRSILGEAWLPAWLEAAVWRFALSAGVCGPWPAIGLWMPSVDSVGRYFPLTLAAVAHHADPRELVRRCGGFLTGVEFAGRDALENDLPPEELVVRLAAAATSAASGPCANLPVCPCGGGLWWTDGAPRVSAGSFACEDLPDENAFAGMLAACYSVPSLTAREPAQ